MTAPTAGTAGATRHRVEVVLPSALASLADSLAVEGWSLIAISPHVVDARTVAVFVRQEAAS